MTCEPAAAGDGRQVLRLRGLSTLACRGAGLAGDAGDARRDRGEVRRRRVLEAAARFDGEDPADRRQGLPLDVAAAYQALHWFPYAALGVIVVSVIYSWVLSRRDPGLGDRVGSIVAGERPGCGPP